MDPTAERPHASMASTLLMASVASVVLLIGGIYWFKMNVVTWIIFGILIASLWGGPIYLRLATKDETPEDT